MACMELPLAAVPDGGARAVAQRQDDGGARSVILLRRGEAVWAYVNRCPHFSLPLDFHPGEFATYEGEVVMCAHHSALFRYDDGLCIDGPCAGHRLDPVAIDVTDGVIRLA